MKIARETEKEKLKSGMPIKAKEKQRETLKNKQKLPFCRGKKQVFSMRSKERKEKTKK